MAHDIYQRAKQNGCYLEATCVGIPQHKWDELMKGARQANHKKATRIAVIAGVIDKSEAKLWNPCTCYVTRTHVIYVHSCIEHFIKVN